MIDHSAQPWLPPLPLSREPVALADLPPVDDRYHAEVGLEPGTLLRVADQLGAQTFSLVEDEVTFHVRGADDQRWLGRLGRPGVVRA
ncbi:hypothetical protein GCM10009616_07940 [Microlunatus lacustris]